MAGETKSYKTKHMDSDKLDTIQREFETLDLTREEYQCLISKLHWTYKKGNVFYSEKKGWKKEFNLQNGKIDAHFTYKNKSRICLNKGLMNMDDFLNLCKKITKENNFAGFLICKDNHRHPNTAWFRPKRCPVTYSDTNILTPKGDEESYVYNYI